MFFERTVLHKAVLGQFTKALRIKRKVENIANLRSKPHQPHGHAPQSRLASAGLRHQFYKAVCRKHLVVGYRVDTIQPPLAQSLDSSADVADTSERALVLERRQRPGETASRNPPKKIQVALVARSVYHRSTQNNGASGQELFRSEFRLAVGRVSIRRLAAGEVDESRHLAVNSIEHLLRKTNVDVEIALRIAHVLQVMRLASKMHDCIDGVSSMTPGDAMSVLGEVSQWTRWSAVYDLEKFTVDICFSEDYSKTYSYNGKK